MSSPVHDNQRGYIALLAVLIVGAASIAVALGLLLTGSDSQRTMLVSQQSLQARNAASACIEEALQVIHDTTTYTGSNTLALTTGSCSYTVTSTGTTTRTIDTLSTVGNSTRKLKVYVTIGTSSISITSWQEVS